MSPFWTVSLFWAAAAACVAVSLVFVLPPLLRRSVAEPKAGRRDINIAVYRDQLREMEADRNSGLLSAEQYQTARLELETRLAEDALVQEAQVVATPKATGARKLGFSLAALLPVASFGLYFLLGNPAAITAVTEAQAHPQAAQGEHDIMKMIQQVEERTRQEPNDVQAWTLLARTYSAVGHWPEALNAWEKARKLRPDVAGILSGYAEALAVSRNRVLEGEPMALILKALELDPNDPKGLELAAIGNFQERNFAKAVFYFKQLYKQLPPETPYAQDILEAQKEAERQIQVAMTGLDNLSNQQAGEAPSTASAPRASIRGSVDIAPALKAKVNDQDMVVLFARATEGGAPVAAIRSTAGRFPIRFELNDSLAMSTDNRLSNYKQVNITARVAKSGDVKGAPGDLEGSLNRVNVGAQDVRLVIDRIRP
ncbi:MAG TPA: c-type cytochrome biogenesis protein CcmI [Thiobacillaceae bacterium]|nr:c-type cytochrome biogenesis protein CcmI [Thiobacillaceae bacterium]HNU63781.1 c-type cytochrome biogenesis protein CcmI [Thiobacillaceae bacterium]